jgi:hypothetical protein
MKPFYVVASVVIVATLLLTPYIELSPTTAQTPYTASEQSLLLSENEESEPVEESADEEARSETAWFPWMRRATGDSVSLAVGSDSSFFGNKPVYGIELTPLKPEKPEVLEANPQMELDAPDRERAGRSSGSTVAEERLPDVLRDLSVQKNKADLEEALASYRADERLQYGNKQSVKEPDLAFIFLIDSTDGTIRSLLVPTQEGWVDFYGGKVITEEGGKFYERNEGIDATLKWWLDDVEPIWVELQQTPGESKKKRKTLGW